MPIFNVLTAVVELVEASSEAEAIQVIKNRLTTAGFDTYDDEAECFGHILPHAFESEDLDEATVAIVRGES
jgi:hypothetical protein